MTSPPPVTPAAPALRTMWLLTRLRINRLLNQMSATYNQPIGGRKSRAATPKKRNRWLVASFVTLIMCFSLGNLVHQSVINLHCHLDASSLCHAGPAVDSVSQGLRYAPDELLAAPFSVELMSGITMALTLLTISGVLMPLATRELAQADWDLEWLATLPVSRTVLLMGRVLERSIANPFGILTAFPACLIIAWYSGYRWSAPLVALCAAFPLLILAALLRTLIDTGLRLLLQPSQLRNLQACITLVGIPILYLAISAGTGVAPFIFDWAAAFPHWAVWLPPGLAVQAINARELSQELFLWFALFAEVALCVALGLRFLQHQLRDGVVAASSRESGRKNSTLLATHPSRRGGLIGSVVQRRELRLLSRDRNFLIQTLVLPVMVVIGQMILNGNVNKLADIGTNPAFTAALAFGISAYVLMLSAFQTLNAEGGALWLLYTFPRSLEGILKEKAQLWALLALAYPIAVFALGIGMSRTFSWELLGLMSVVLIGIPIYSLIAIALGVFGCDPLAQDAQTRIRPSYLYGYMLLSGVYVYSIYSGPWWQKLVYIVLIGGLAVSLWQKAKDELPYLLDPVALPAARVSLSDGLIAAVIFFLLQGVVSFFVRDDDGNLNMASIATAFFVAGAVTYAMFRWEYWRSKAQGVPKVIGAGVSHTLGWGFGMGAVATILGVLYIEILRYLGLWHQLAPAVVKRDSVAWLVVLTMIAAPLFEEFIFRGLIFGGLRRSTTAFVAIVGSAAIFAIVHPPLSMLPVFGLGICAATAYERTRTLLAPMLVHAGYNAVIVGVQLMWH